MNNITHTIEATLPAGPLPPFRPEAQAPGLSSEIERAVTPIPAAPVAAAPVIEKLAYNLAELQQITGLSRVTIWRLEIRGQLRPVAGVRSKIYSRAEVLRFLNGKNPPRC
jgi:predicted DNA-binding transcriptional regulator AlpA